MTDRYLHVLTGPGRGRRHPLPDGETTIGREVVNKIVLPDGLVSRRHAVVSLANGVVELRDTGSTNGTFVNGSRVSGVRVLRAGDTVRFGQTTMGFEEEGRAQPEPVVANESEVSTRRALSIEPEPFVEQAPAAPEPEPEPEPEARPEGVASLDAYYVRRVTVASIVLVLLILFVVLVLVR